MNYSGKHIKRIGVLKNDHGYGANVIRYHPNGKQIAVTGGSNPYVYIYDIEQQKLIKRFDKFWKGSGGESISYDGSGKYLVHKANQANKFYSNPDTKNYYIARDVRNGYQVVQKSILPEEDSMAVKYLYPYPGNKNKIFTVNRGYSALQLASPKFYIFSIPEMTISSLAQGHWLIDKEDFALSPDGNFLVDCEAGEGHEGKRGLGITRYHLRIWKFPEMELIKTIEDAFENAQNVLAWNPNGKTIYSCGIIPKITLGSNPNLRQNKVILWDTTTWKIEQQYIRATWGSKGLSYLSDRKHVFSLGGTINPKLYIENSLNGELIETLELPHNPYVETLEQSSVDKNQFALGFKDEIWLFKIVDLP